ncbi:hypothetical protein GN958_ATG14094, partial [Phytophthora infestans]
SGIPTASRRSTSSFMATGGATISAKRSTLAIEERSRRLAGINRPLATSINITTETSGNDRKMTNKSTEATPASRKNLQTFTLQTTTDQHHQSGHCLATNLTPTRQLAFLH